MRAMTSRILIALVIAASGGCSGGGSSKPAPQEPAPTTTTAPTTTAPTAPTATNAAMADAAAAVNEEGKQLMFAGKYADASAKFRDAVARAPEPKYFFNLCTSLFQEGKFAEALTSCNAVGEHAPPEDLAAKTAKMITKIKDEAKQQNIQLKP
jgi:TolA-binding protein